jgi:hypothetical protein
MALRYYYRSSDAFRTKANGNANWRQSVMNVPVRHTWLREGLGGRRRWPCSTSRSVGQATTPSAFQDQVGTGGVIDAKLHPIGVPEIKLRQVAMQVRFANMLVDAIDAALKDGVIAFNGIGVDVATYIFLHSVVHGAMLGELPADTGVDWAFIGHKPGIAVDMASNQRSHIGGGDVRNVQTADPSASLNQGDDWVLVGGAGADFSPDLPSNVGFINLDNPPYAAQRLEADSLHGLADAMGHEPSGFQGHTHSPVDLVAADPLLARCDEVNGLEPNVQRDMAGFEYGPDLHSEWRHAGVALPETRASGLAVESLGSVEHAAFRANRPIWPEPCFEEAEGGWLILEVFGGENWLGHRDCSYGLNTTSRTAVCQV